MSEDPRFEILEVWRRPLGGDGEAAVRVLARIEAGAYGPEEYAVGVSIDPDSVFAGVKRFADERAARLKAQREALDSLG